MRKRHQKSFKTIYKSTKKIIIHDKKTFYKKANKKMKNLKYEKNIILKVI